jgi:hypothetical protein
MRRVLIYHIIALISALAVWVLFSEALTKFIAPGYDSVELWLTVNAVGIILLFGVTLISFSIFWWRRTKQ